MSPKTKLVVGGVGAAAVTSSVVMSSVALANQGISTDIENAVKDAISKLPTPKQEVTKSEFDKLKESIDSLDEKIGKAVDTKVAGLSTPNSEVTKQEFEDLKDRVNTLEEKAKLAGDEAAATDLSGIKKDLEKQLQEKLKGVNYEELKIQVEDLNNQIKELKTKVEKSGVDVSKHSSVTALEQQAKSFKETLDKLDKEQKAQESRYERLDREVKVLEREKIDKLEKQFNGLDEKLKAQDTKISQEIEIAKVDVSNDIKGQVEEIKRLTKEAKERVEKLEAMKQFSDATRNNEYMQDLAKHAEGERSKISKDITDLRNKINDLSYQVLELKNR